MPPGMFRSRSFTRFTMRVGFPHLGQSVLLEVSIIFLRSAVLATLAMVQYSPVKVDAVRSGYTVIILHAPLLLVVSKGDAHLHGEHDVVKMTGLVTFSSDMSQYY